MKELRSEIEINASPEKVWELLCDSPGIPEPMRSAIIDRPVGVQLKVKLGTRSGKGATFKMKLISVEPCRELRWKGHL